MTSSAPQMIPVLSPGRHRRPDQGACFMEMASVLAGESWSDSPPCTHPLLARLARRVNDLTSDAGRVRLTPMIPSVIGLTSDDPRWDDEIALLTATLALPLAAPRDQPPLAAGLLVCEALVAAREGRDRTAPLRGSSRDALAAAPQAAVWARDFVAQLGGPGSRTHPGAAIVDFAAGAVVAGRHQADAELFGLLVAVISLCRRLSQVAPAAVGAADQRRRTRSPSRGTATVQSSSDRMRWASAWAASASPCTT